MTKLFKRGDEEHFEGYALPRADVTDDELLADAAREVYATVGQFEVPDGRITLDSKLMADIDRYLNMRLDVLKTISDLEEVAKARKEDIDLWLHSEKRVLERKVEVLEATLLQIADNADFPGGKKSIRLAHGVIGRSSSQEKLEIVDKEAALKYAKKNKLPYKKVEEPYVGELKEYYLATGDVPSGCKVIKAEDRPYVKNPG